MSFSQYKNHIAGSNELKLKKKIDFRFLGQREKKNWVKGGSINGH